MWTPETSCGNEAAKCRGRVVSFLVGRGLDIGCGDEKVVPAAIGVDIAGKAADIRLDLSEPNALRMFADGAFDYVFSSHCLEYFHDTEGVLREWWRVLKVGGYLILYGPDPDFYPRVGQQGANPNHKKDLYWQDVWNIVRSFGGATRVSASRHNEGNEYSWQLVVKKKAAICAQPPDPVPWYRRVMVFPRKKATKSALVIRYGAYGDQIIASALLPYLAQDGYEITYNTVPRALPVLKHNPHIKRFLVQDNDAIPNPTLPEYWKEIGASFDRVINLSGSIEDALLKAEGRPEYATSPEVLRRSCSVNYYDATLERAGYKVKGARGQLFFSEMEETMARIFRTKYADRFIVMWALAGSSFHKVYPWTEHACVAFLERHKDAIVITVGDHACKILEWSHPQVMCKAGVWDIRQTLLMTKYVDLVVGPETGVLNAAGCFPTPKIVMLTHSSHKNLCRYWENDYCIQSPAACSPCHRLIYTKDGSGKCPQSLITNSPICMELIRPEDIVQRMETVYAKWTKEGPLWKNLFSASTSRRASRLFRLTSTDAGTTSPAIPCPTLAQTPVQ